MLFPKALYSWEEPKALRRQIGLASLRNRWKHIVSLWLGVAMLFLLPFLFSPQGPFRILELLPVAIALAVSGLVVFMGCLNVVAARSVKLYENRITVRGSTKTRVLFFRDIQQFQFDVRRDNFGCYQVFFAQSPEATTVLEVLWNPLSSLGDLREVLAAQQILLLDGRSGEFHDAE